MEEFRFITSHFDLEKFWIGAIQEKDHFEDGTEVDPEVAKEYDPLVPWTDPGAIPPFKKRVICRRFASEEVNRLEPTVGR